MDAQFKCEKCAKEYKSERFYLKHIDNNKHSRKR